MNNDEPDTLAGQIEEFNEAIVELRDELLITIPTVDRETIESQSDDISLFQDYIDAIFLIASPAVGIQIGAAVGYLLGFGRDVSVAFGVIVGVVVGIVALRRLRGR